MSDVLQKIVTHEIQAMQIDIRLRTELGEKDVDFPVKLEIQEAANQSTQRNRSKVGKKGIPISKNFILIAEEQEEGAADAPKTCIVIMDAFVADEFEDERTIELEHYDRVKLEDLVKVKLGVKDEGVLVYGEHETEREIASDADLIAVLQQFEIVSKRDREESLNLKWRVEAEDEDGEDEGEVEG